MNRLRRERRRTGRGCACAPAPVATCRAPVDERELLLAARSVAKHLRAPLGAARGGERGCDALDQMILLQPVGDEVADGADLEPVGPGEIHEIVEPRHRPVVAHDLADHRARIEAGEAGNVDRRLGMAGADEDSAGPRHQREDMAGRDQRVGPVAGIDRHAQSVRARSAALIPVEIPSLASMETVKAVSLRLRLVRVIGSRPSWSDRSLVSARQMRPRPWRAMKLTASGVPSAPGR